MKIQICSDLHLEHAMNRYWLKDNPLKPLGDILIVAGDTYYLDRDFRSIDFVNRVSDEFEHVYLIPGNHEYYGGFDVSNALNPTKKRIKENVTLLNNEVIELNDVKFIFSTMWSRIERNIIEVVRGMADFRMIKSGEESLTIDLYNQLHDAAFAFLSHEIKGKEKKIVVTHHLPSNNCNVQEFKGSPLNEAFSINKTNFIFNNDIDYWIYGHSHRNKADFNIGNTTMVTNQMGYTVLNEHNSFSYEKVIEI